MRYSHFFSWFFAASCLAVAWWMLRPVDPQAPAIPAAMPSSSAGLPSDLVALNTELPGVVIDPPYAGEDNFFRQKFYASKRLLLRKPVVEKLKNVQTNLQQQGYGLKIWDGYRPLSVQKEMWKVMPNPDYVADPAKGSRHNRGAAVDVTLVDAQGKEVEMPTGFDDFSPQAHSEAPASAAATRHRQILTEAMAAEGFTVLKTEWWHFDAPGWEAYPVMDVTVP
jgi:D-alanyl-D-alanine dipeptidase